MFIDSVHLIGTIVERDQWRFAALRAESEFSDRLRVTSDGVFHEVLAYVSRHGVAMRSRATAAVWQLKGDDDVIVVPHTEALVEDALNLYGGEFLHTRLSLQDCIAIQIMRDFDIAEILTADQEFALAGVTPLLRRFA